MGITLEWVRLPDGLYFRTICRDGVPLPVPTRYLRTFANPGVGSTRTVDTYAQRLLPFFRWLEDEGLALTNLTPAFLQQFRRDLLMRDVTKSPLLTKGPDSSDETVRSTWATTIRFVRWAVGPDDNTPLFERRQGGARVSLPQFLPHEIGLMTTDAPSGRRKQKVPKYLTQQQLDACRTWIMESYAFDPQLQVRNRAILEILWDGALRKGALLGLRTDRIDWQGRTITVVSSEEDCREAWYRKGHNQRAIKVSEYNPVLDDHTMLWLARYRDEARPVDAIRLGHGFFFCEYSPRGTDHGQPLALATLEYLFEAMRKPVDKGGVGFRVRPHMFRHTWSNMAERDGLRIEARKYQLGHASGSASE